MNTLCIDIGGTNLKALVVDATGKATGQTVKSRTPARSDPEQLLAALAGLWRRLGPFDRVAVGFPGVVDKGVTINAPNLYEDSWREVPLAERISAMTSRPTRVANDADVQGLGTISGDGVELVITLGTGVGSSLFVDGQLVPNLELGHLPFEEGQSYEQRLGKPVLADISVTTWNTRLQRAIRIWQRCFNPRTLHLGGGHANLINFSLPPGVRRTSNVKGLLGGLALWRSND